ncbi:hypothetical protein GCM10010399_63630 [Dactylosporangium fulvum]|uniref:Uncharacterized protein n=1 Tax=Dactylosporangium fulvum TaxID=53359 RepID=A0ABY5W9W9_9ACTN|nr:hypothetical protein [Dactylosporangium fulvum]UWP85814.1 hypothetical protein Dfulv_16840 [Dactylosporangium fulvum]
MTTTRANVATPPVITVRPDGLGYRYCRHFPRVGPHDSDYELTREGAVWRARQHLRAVYGINATTSPDVIARATEIVAPRLSFPSEAARLVAELDLKGLLAGGFPREDTTAAADVAAVVRWRQVATPPGCYTAADYERAAADLAAELDAAGLLVAPFTQTTL